VTKQLGRLLGQRPQHPTLHAGAVVVADLSEHLGDGRAAVVVFGLHGDDEQQLCGALGEFVGQIFDERRGLWTRPVQVVDHQQQGLLARDPLQQPKQKRQEPLRAVAAPVIAPRPALHILRVGWAQEREHQLKIARRGQPVLGHQRIQPIPQRPFRQIPRFERALQRLPHAPPAPLTLPVKRPHRHPKPFAGLKLLGGPASEPRLADARVPFQGQDHPLRGRQHLVGGPHDGFALVIAPHQQRRPASPPRCTAQRHQRPRRLPQIHSLPGLSRLSPFCVASLSRFAFAAQQRRTNPAHPLQQRAPRPPCRAPLTAARPLKECAFAPHPHPRPQTRCAASRQAEGFGGSTR
jgi:hypothetical protein